MKRFFQKIGYRIARFMYGRYGNDEWNLVLMIVALVFALLGAVPVPFFWLFSILGTLLMLRVLFRSFSKNLPKRRRELERYLKIKNAPKNARKLRKNKKRDKHTHCYFKCPKCRAVLRVPLGKGNIIVTCPRCSERIEKKT
ncbi:MAG: hypothetical protein IJW30_03185 [Clostridia bacterium]|nr:hypothetical protein [Clostridia bacterium]